MSPESAMSPQREAAVHWVVTLVEPLLASADRDRYLQGMREACAASPGWAAVFFGGLVADLVLTLPERDPWRALSARVGSTTVGPRPPDLDGAVTAAARPFGAWTDAEDLLTPVYERVELDPSLSGLTSGLAPHAAALLAGAGYGWQAGRQIALAVAAGDLAGLFDAGHAAASWALHRRRSYGVVDDPWPVESAYRWSWRAEQEIAGKQWPLEPVQEAIDEERVESLLRDGAIGD